MNTLTENNHHFGSATTNRVNELFDMLINHAGDIIKNRFEHDPTTFDGKVLAILNSGKRSVMSKAAANNFGFCLH